MQHFHCVLVSRRRLSKCYFNTEFISRTVNLHQKPVDKGLKITHKEEDTKLSPEENYPRKLEFVAIQFRIIFNVTDIFSAHCDHSYVFILYSDMRISRYI